MGQGLKNNNRFTGSISDSQGQSGGFEPSWVESKVKAGKVEPVERGEAVRETPTSCMPRTDLAYFFIWPGAGLLLLMVRRSLCVGMTKMV